jgi:hypothetical protein
MFKFLAIIGCLSFLAPEVFSQGFNFEINESAQSYYDARRNFRRNGNNGTHFSASQQRTYYKQWMLNRATSTGNGVQEIIRQRGEDLAHAYNNFVANKDAYDEYLGSQNSPVADGYSAKQRRHSRKVYKRTERRLRKDACFAILGSKSKFLGLFHRKKKCKKVLASFAEKGELDE